MLVGYRYLKKSRLRKAFAPFADINKGANKEIFTH
jgi:hypothetical protein